MPLAAGDLDRLITLQRASGVADEYNETVEVWNSLGEVFAVKEDIRDGERFGGGEIAANITTRFRIRWSHALADLNPKDRVVYDGRVYNIIGTKEIGRREGLEITATAGAD